MFEAFPISPPSKCVIIIAMFIKGFVASLVISILLAGCATGGTKATASLGQEFSLAVGESAAIRGEDLEITFLEVLEDSRCPTGAQCIWEGQAKSLVKIEIGNNIRGQIELTEPGLTDQTNPQTFRDYQIEFHLLPYPEVGKEITAEQYRLRLTITRAQ